MLSHYQDRPCLVTGATGLAGAAVCDMLIRRGADVTVLIRDWVPQSTLITSGNINRVKQVRGDILDRDLLERIMGENEIDTIFHLAAQSIVVTAWRNPISTMQTNIIGTANVLEAARRSPTAKRVVVASSDKAYGDKEGVYHEDMPMDGKNPYDCTKSCGDLIAQMYAKSYGMSVGIARCGNIYGRGDLNWNRIIPNTIRRIIRRQRPVIYVNPQRTRDYLYLDDCAEAYLSLGEYDQSGAFNLAGGKTYTVRQVIDTISRIMCYDGGIEIVDAKVGEIEYQALDINKAARLLNWSPAHTFDEGIAETVRWYEDYFYQQSAVSMSEEG